MYVRGPNSSFFFLPCFLLLTHLDCPTPYPGYFESFSPKLVVLVRNWLTFLWKVLPFIQFTANSKIYILSTFFFEKNVLSQKLKTKTLLHEKELIFFLHSYVSEHWVSLGHFFSTFEYLQIVVSKYLAHPKYIWPLLGLHIVL